MATLSHIGTIYPKNTKEAKDFFTTRVSWDATFVDKLFALIKKYEGVDIKLKWYKQ